MLAIRTRPRSRQSLARLTCCALNYTIIGPCGPLARGRSSCPAHHQSTPSGGNHALLPHPATPPTRSGQYGGGPRRPAPFRSPADPSRGQRLAPSQTGTCRAPYLGLERIAEAVPETAATSRAPLRARAVPEGGERFGIALVGGDQRAIESANLIAFDIDRPDHLQPSASPRSRGAQPHLATDRLGEVEVVVGVYPLAGSFETSEVLRVVRSLPMGE